MATRPDGDDPPPDAPTTWIRKLTHELGNAVWAISGYSELLQRSFRRDEEAQVGKDLESLSVAAERILVLSAQLRLASHCAGKLEAGEPEADLAAVYAQLRARLATRDPTSPARLPPALPGLRLAMSPPLLAAILEQLLANSLEFTEGALSMAAEDSPDGVELVLEDSGPRAGEAEPELWRQPMQGSAGRLGLGLSLAAATLEALEGSLVVTRLPGRGVRWHLTMPSAGGGAAGPRAGAATGAPGPCLLYVDDQSVNRRLIERALLAAGWRVRTAGSGAEALRELDEAPPDLVLTDLHMPEMDGFELTRRIRKAAPGLPVVAFSASTTDEAAVSADDRSLFDEFLTKSGEIEGLDGLLRNLLAPRAAGREAPPDLAGQVAALRVALEELATVGSAATRLERARSLLETARELSARLEAAGRP